MTSRVPALLFLCCNSVAAQTNDWIIEPGLRIGPITSQTNRQELKSFFGPANVADQDVDTGEGPEPATVVLPNDRSAQLAILWRNDRIDPILVCFKSEFGPCKWHTRDGVTLGTALLNLESLNGRPFAIEPWGSDIGGNIISWREGKLADRFGDLGNFHLLLTLNWPHKSTGPTPRQKQALDEIDRSSHDLLSSASAVRRLRPEVTRIVLFFSDARRL